MKKKITLQEEKLFFLDLINLLNEDIVIYKQHFNSASNVKDKRYYKGILRAYFEFYEMFKIKSLKYDIDQTYVDIGIRDLKKVIQK